jgi:hypothetical protein
MSNFKMEKNKKKKLEIKKIKKCSKLKEVYILKSSKAQKLKNSSLK